MHKSILLTSFLFFLCLLNAELLFGQRYATDQFTTIDKQTFPYATVDGEELYLDLYTAEGDTEKKKPVILYVHGGGFANGTRDGKNLVDFAHDFAKKGYAVASISYRLTMKDKSFGCDQAATNKINTFKAATQDIRWATQFILNRQTQWGIDPDKIVLAGSSAGAEAIVHAAYWPLDELPAQTATFPSGFRYAGLISMAGAIVDLQLINEETAIPSLFFHGTCDNLVPYATAPHHYCQPGNSGYLVLHGARSMADRLHDLGKPYYLFTACNGKHEWAGKPLSANRHTILDFMYHDIMRKSFRQISEVVKQEGGCNYHEKDFPYCK